MRRGFDLDFRVRPGLPEENFVAEAIGNVVAFQLQRKRGEPLRWQVVRVEGAHSHHFRLVVVHPDRAFDPGIELELRHLLHELSDESVDQLRQKLQAAEHEGLRPLPLRHVRESVDFWNDDFWNWVG